MKPAEGAVAELQGLYGPFSFPEKLLQKIWLRGDFMRTAARTIEGQQVRVLHPGRWNLLGGPDFTGARLQFEDGPVVTGDVELHLHTEDWAAHAHAKDTAYDGVVLHVVLFSPRAGQLTVGVGGREIPTLALLPLLHHDLEEFAADEAVENLAVRRAARVVEELSRRPLAEVRGELEERARQRWTQKVRFARLRVERLGWSDACHQTALEILGYRFNRAPMLRIAGAVGLSRWSDGSVNMDELFASEAEAWSVQGVRPANHPRLRLAQYAAWTRARSNWPERLVEFGAGLPVVSGAGTRVVRREMDFSGLAERARVEICADAVGGARLSTLVCDGFWPLLSARAGGADQFDRWFHWFAGDWPEVVRGGLRQLAVCDGRVQPLCHGLAQGLLGWLIAKEQR